MNYIVIILLIVVLLIILIKVKKKINKKIKISIAIILAIIIIIGITIIYLFISPKSFMISSTSNIQERKYHKISDNLYYTNDLINSERRENKEKIIDYYKTISNYLNKKYPNLSFYIDYFNYETFKKDKKEITFNLYQMIDMAIIEKTLFIIEMKNGRIIEYDDSDDEILDSDNFIYSKLKATKNVNIKEVKKIALDLTQQHADDLFISLYFIRAIKGECYLKYNNENNFYYTVSYNNGSYVNIDTITGNVINYRITNGIGTGSAY